LLSEIAMALVSVSLKSVPRSKIRYSNALRCIGQNLESMELKAVEIKTHGENYVVQLWYKGISLSMDLEQHYTLDDIKQLEIKGREKGKAFGASPNLLSLSHVLRLAGNYVDRIGGRLIRVSWQDQSDKIQSVTIQFEPSSGSRGGKQGESQVTTIEELCIHIYKQKKRINASADKAAQRPFVNLSDSSRGRTPAPVVPLRDSPSEITPDT
jgi:hypothetical protein